MAINAPDIQISTSKKNQHSRDMTDSRVVAGKLQNKPRMSYAKRQERVQKMMERCQKDTKAIVKGFPMAKYGTI